jgi:type II secretory ATPase GspE/PulE/Tfp pilus assembly ATPase PilB-like protein
MLRVPYGIILVSGPTGAGKTTTLYAALNSLDQTERNIITVEDPVEYRFSNINQIQVNPRAGITFASGLRSILRLDPDVILIGEIRDAETANIAIQSALTGHLVLSSIHANDAIGVVMRLVDLGVEPFLVASALIGVISQRMARRICPDCGRPQPASAEETLIYAKEIGEERTEFVYGAGCTSCSNSGYRGRTGIFEILTVTDTLKTLLLRQATTNDLRTEAIKDGMVTLLRDGMEKVRQNITTPTEVLRNAYTVG